MMIENAVNNKKSVIDLLDSENLPVKDLPLSLENFFLARDNTMAIGVVGLEIYGRYALLRSLVVKKKFRNRGVANELIRHIENLAATNGLEKIYLLTETAPEYFHRKGYNRLNRGDVPSEIQQSSEFSHVCPESAIVMSKSLLNYEKMNKETTSSLNGCD